MDNLSFIDYSGSIVGLIYNKNRRFRSNVGGFLSLLMIFGIISVAIIYLNEFFGRKKPKMSFEDMKYWNPPPQNVSSNFQFAILMSYKDINQIRNDIIKIDAVYILKNKTQIEMVPLPSIPCELASMDQIDDSFIQQLSNSLCFDLTNLTLTGTKVTDVFQYIQIRFTLCVDTNSNSCLPLGQMKQFFEDNTPLALIYFLDTIFQTNDKKKVTYFFNSVDVNVTYGNSKQTNVFFSKNEMLVDDSYFFPSAPQVYSHFMIDSFRDLVSVRTEKQTDILAINLMLSKNKRVIYISYMQISELMASISALANVIMVFFNFTGDLFNHHLFQSDLVQTLFQINNDSNSDNNNTITKMKGKRYLIQMQNASIQSRDSTQNRIINHYQQKDRVQMSLFGPSNLQPQVKSMIQRIAHINNHNNSNSNSKHQTDPQFSFRNQKQSLHISKRDINKVITSHFFPLCWSKGFEKTKKDYQNLNDFMLVYQEQKNLFRKLQEIDLLKYLLFTEEQFDMYQEIPKPEFITHDSLYLKEKEFSSFFCREGCRYLKSNANNNNNDANNMDENHLNMQLKNSILSKDNNYVNRRMKMNLS